MFGQLAKGVIGGNQDLRQALVVAQKDIVARLQFLDQVRFKKQRLDLGFGDDHLQRLGLADHPHQPVRQPVRLRIAGNPPCQIARLADIQRLANAVQHPVDAGVAAQLAHLTLQIGKTARQVGRQVGIAGLPVLKMFLKIVLQGACHLVVWCVLRIAVHLWPIYPSSCARDRGCFTVENLSPKTVDNYVDELQSAGLGN